MQKYVWWDDVQRLERSRIDLRVPKPLHEFLRAVAKRNGVTVNDVIVGVLVYAADSDAKRRLRVEIVPAVRVTESKPDAAPVDIPVATPSSAVRKRWQIPYRP